MGIENVRQPQMVKVTIESDCRLDVIAEFTKMMKFLDGHFANVDFQWEGGKVVLRAYPFAVND